MAWLLLTLPLALLASWYHPRFWIPLELKKFVANGARDSLQEVFHRQRLTWRIAIALVVALGGAAPLLWVHGFAFVLLAAALLVLQAAYWSYDFNPRLNVARQQPYIGRYHVSWSPGAAKFPDRYIWQQAVRAFPDQSVHQPEYIKGLRVELAGQLLEDLLDKVLRYGVLAALVMAGTAFWVAYA